MTDFCFIDSGVGGRVLEQNSGSRLQKTDFCFVDSGVGGIPYMKALLDTEPDAACMYVADTANFPYGTKTHEQIVESVSALVKKICEKFSPSVIVLACNTISVNALETLRKDFPENEFKTKFVGTVPAIKLAAKISAKRKIGLLATDATCKNPYNMELKEKFAEDCELVLRGDGELVSYIEHNAFTASHEELLQAVRPAVEFFKEQDCDVVILGCTHFLNVKEVFIEAFGKEISVVDSVDGVVRHALDVWKGEGALRGSAPAEGVAQKTAANEVSEDFGAQGETSPSHKLFVTSLGDKSEALQYEVLCRRFGIEFSGKI